MSLLYAVNPQKSRSTNQILMLDTNYSSKTTFPQLLNQEGGKVAMQILNNPQHKAGIGKVVAIAVARGEQPILVWGDLPNYLTKIQNHKEDSNTTGV